MSTLWYGITLSLFIKLCSTSLSGARLGDFPSPDFTKTIKLTSRGYHAFAEVNHNFGIIPFHVRVYAFSKDGDNANYLFEGVGSCQNDGQGSVGFGGILFAYNKSTVRLWAPTKMGRVIFVGEGWGGNMNSQSSTEAFVTVHVWKNGPSPSFQKVLQIHSKRTDKIELQHPLRQIPEIISVRVTSSNRKEGDFFFNAIGSAQTSSQSRSFGGVIFAYNHNKIVLWTPNESKTGCINIGKRWGNGKYAARSIQNCTLHIRLWVNSFPPPIFQTDWIPHHANKHKASYVEIKHDLKILPSYVKVQYRAENKPDALIYEGFGSAQTTPLSSYKYGGILYAYSRDSVRLWLPTSSKPDQAYIVFVGDGWGSKNITISSALANIRIQIYANRCFREADVIDAQGYCRDATDTSLTQMMGLWEKCSNPCGEGTKHRNIRSCSGKSLQTVIRCNFDNGSCGFKGDGFTWTVTSGVSDWKTSSTLQIPSQGPIKGMNFIYSNTSQAKPGEKGSLVSKEISNGEKCILSFKYLSESYFGILKVNLLREDGKLIEDVWYMLDDEVMKGVWRSAYINFGHTSNKPIKRFMFVQQLTIQSGACPDECHPISLADITLKCVKPDSHIIPSEQCKKKEDVLPTCLFDVFKPFRKGPAWSINHTFVAVDDEKKNLGLFVTAVGEKEDLIATYKFHVMKSGSYNLWLDSFANSTSDNGITVQMQDGDKTSRDLIFTRQHALWFPFSVTFELQAGTYYVHLYLKEKYFRYRNIMIAPKYISAWTDLGMQSRFIPDSSFSTVGGSSAVYYVYARLNGLGAWMLRENPGTNYLQIILPELAIINKVATQGGKSFEEFSRYCQTDLYKVKFSLDGTSFVYYRISSLDDVYVFTGNTGSPNEVKEHTLHYAIVARAIRFYPFKFDLRSCLRIELYGYYITPEICPQMDTKVRNKTCFGDGDCRYKNAECALNEGLNKSECTCKKSFHGEKCELVGCNPDPCKNNATCFGDETSFTCACKPGFKGRYCEVPCPSGSYGINCKSKCECPKREYCHPGTGSCSCFPGYHGNDCKTPCANNTYGQGCEQTCACEKFMLCDHVTGKCQCEAGYYGNACKNQCLPGTYGFNCSQNCSCVHGVCNATDGFCFCDSGWMGPACDFKCQQGRYGSNCKEYCHNPKKSTCDAVTGHYTCIAGYTGLHCEQRCVEGKFGKNCESECKCYMNHTDRCDMRTGECICKAGYQGEKCEEPCENMWGPNCLHQCKCKHDAICDGRSGACTCLDGYVGTYCERKCEKFRYGKDCAHNCSCIQKHTEYCLSERGVCSCKPGYHGERCQRKCDQNHWGKNCLEDCKCWYGALCDHRSGFCYCRDGFQGLYCEEECDEGRYGKHCANICQCKNEAYCYNVNGKCECTAGFTGDFCELTCPRGFYGLNCVKQCACVRKQTSVCDPVNGSCLCRPGYQGIFCEKECVDGLYGQHCASQCSCHHSKQPCNKVTGDCICTPGFTGRSCATDCAWSNFGPKCQETCSCENGQLCNNVDGSCFNATKYSFDIHLLVSADIFSVTKARDYLKKNVAHLMFLCMGKYMTRVEKYPTGNLTLLGMCRLDRPGNLLNDAGNFQDQYFARIVKITKMHSKDGEDVSSVQLSLFRNSTPVDGGVVENVLKFIGADNLSIFLKHTYYTGEVLTPSKQSKPWHEGKMKNIIIGASVFGGLLVIFIIGLIVRCTKRVQYPSLFTKIKQDPKEIEMPMLPTKNTILAFENPYYDVIAAMGLDDDIEEDYYNPLYDNMLELQTDSETEPEDIYYGYRNNRYRRNHYPYDKDSGFSSGTLM